jgi:hypothetical protein
VIQMNDRGARSQPTTPESEERLLARRYMLGGLSSQQQDEVERRFLFDPAFEDVVLEEETDLFDALAASTLSSEDERALRLWASVQQRTQTRLAAAIAFHRLTFDTAPNPSRHNAAPPSWLVGILAPRFSALWFGGIAVASLALVITTVWLTRSRPVTPISNSAAARLALPTIPPAAPTYSSSPNRDAAAPARPGSVATIFLMAEETRNSSAPPQLHLKPGTSTVTLQLGSQTGLSVGRHTVQLSGPDGSAVQPTDVHSRRLHGQNFLEATLDASALRPGEYTILLQQKDTSGVPAPLIYHFRIIAP